MKQTEKIVIKMEHYKTSKPLKDQLCQNLQRKNGSK